MATCSTFTARLTGIHCFAYDTGIGFLWCTFCRTLIQVLLEAAGILEGTGSQHGPCFRHHLWNFSKMQVPGLYIKPRISEFSDRFRAVCFLKAPLMISHHISTGTHSLKVTYRLFCSYTRVLACKDPSKTMHPTTNRCLNPLPRLTESAEHSLMF